MCFDSGSHIENVYFHKLVSQVLLLCKTGKIVLRDFLKRYNMYINIYIYIYIYIIYIYIYMNTTPLSTDFFSQNTDF